MTWEQAEQTLATATHDGIVGWSIERTTTSSAGGWIRLFTIVIREAHSEFAIKTFDVTETSLEVGVNAALDFLVNARLNSELLAAVPF